MNLSRATLLAVALLSAPLSADELTNADIVALVQAKLSVGVIQAKIRGSSHRFDVSTVALVNLKHAGVPDEVIEAMVLAEAPASPPPLAGGSGFGGSPPPAVVASSGTRSPGLALTLGAPAKALDSASYEDLYKPIADLRGCPWAMDSKGLDPWGSVTAFESHVQWKAQKGEQVRNLAWAKLTRVCVDDGPVKTWVEFWSADERLMRVADVPTRYRANPGEAIAGRFIRRLQQLKADGLQSLQGVDFSLDCP